VKARVSISIAEQHLSTLDAYCESQGMNRIAAVEEALNLWLRYRRDEALAAGYRDMAAENLRVAEDQLGAYAGLEADGRGR
jgi:hypothetical protein